MSQDTVSSPSTAQRKRTMVLEVEMPNYYCDDMPELIEQFGDPDEPVSDQLLNDSGLSTSGLLIVQVTGEKDGWIERSPVHIIGARIEDREPPTSNADWLVERVDEPFIEEQFVAACNRSRLRIYERLIGQLASEYTGQVKHLAVQAQQEADLAEREIEAGLEGRRLSAPWS